MTPTTRLGPCSLLSLLSLSVALSACSSLESDKINYKSATKAPTLEVPPDLTQLSGDTRYALGGGSSVSATGFQAAMGKQPVSAIQTAASSLGDVRVERSGNQRWLVVKRSADQLWTPVHDFWVENGFSLVTEDSRLGIMETDWAENRAKLPQDWIRNTLGKVIDSLYDTGERDRFRTRLERAADGSTEIYISHRGMYEVYVTEGKDQTRWQPREVDPELEAEMLRRMMVRFGADGRACVFVQTSVLRVTTESLKAPGVLVTQPHVQTFPVAA